MLRKERCLVHISFARFDLRVPGIGVQCWKDLLFPQRADARIHLGERVAISNGDFVETTIVDAEPKALVVFGEKKLVRSTLSSQVQQHPHWSTHRLLRFPDCDRIAQLDMKLCESARSMAGSNWCDVLLQRFPPISHTKWTGTSWLSA